MLYVNCISIELEEAKKRKHTVHVLVFISVCLGGNYYWTIEIDDRALKKRKRNLNILIKGLT